MEPPPPPVDERALRAPTPPPLIPRRGVPIPARPLVLEPVSPSPALQRTQLDDYVRNASDREEVEVMRDLPFGQSPFAAHTPFGSDTPFHAEGEGDTVFDDGDTDGIPVGLPDLLHPVVPERSLPVEAPPPVVPTGHSTAVVALAFAGGLVLGLSVGWLL